MAVQLQSNPVPSFRILIVDDERLVTGVLKRLFDTHSLTVCHCAMEAITILDEFADTFDVVLCDVTLPDMSGIDLYTYCQKKTFGLEHYIVFISGGPVNPQVWDALCALPNLCIEKPFDLEDLRFIVEELGSTRQARRLHAKPVPA